MLQAFEAEGGVAGLGARHKDDERVVAQGNAVEVFVDWGEQLSGVEFVVAQGLFDGERTLFEEGQFDAGPLAADCLLYTSPSPRDLSTSRMPSSA